MDHVPASAPASHAVPPEASVRSQLERLLESTAFRYSERLSRFLRFVVEQQLAGNTDRLKETVLAIEIFDREATYDSHVDSIVRVEARRLRDKLDKYYAAEGRDDRVLIALPKGTYVPAIGWRVDPAAEAPVAPPPRPFPWKPAAAAAAVLCLLITFGIWRWTASRPGLQPAVQRLTSDSGLTFEPALSRDGKLLAFSSDRAGGSALDIWVRQVPRGGAARITDAPGDEVEPAFSPDATQVAYRAEGELDGIYVAPTLGGRSTLLARGGYRPRFSPDGRRVAFWTGERTFRTAKIFLVPATGGAPVQFQPEFSYAAYPIWSPGGRDIVFVGARSMLTGDPNLDDWDWWAAPAEGGPAAPLAARRTFNSLGLRPPETGWTHRRIVPYGFDDSGNIIFSARSGDQTNVWRVHVSMRRWQVDGRPAQLTFGAGRQDHPSSAADGALVFSALTQKSDLWSLPIAGDAAEPKGPMARLSSGPSDSNRAVVSRDGRRIAFISNRTGSEEVWTMEVQTRRERALTATGDEKSAALISPDGSTVAFGNAAPLKQAILTIPFESGPATQICADCGQPRAWMPNGRDLLYQRTGSSGESLIGVVRRGGPTAPLVRIAGSAVFSPSVSSDGKWIALIVRTPPKDHRIMVAPLDGESAGSASEWFPANEPGTWVDKPRWSATGHLLYYVSDRDGFVCIWSRRFSPGAKVPFGEPKAILHFHTARMSIGNVYGLDLAVAEDKLVFNVGETSGNVWLSR